MLACRVIAHDGGNHGPELHGRRRGLSRARARLVGGTSPRSRWRHRAAEGVAAHAVRGRLRRHGLAARSTAARTRGRWSRRSWARRWRASTCPAPINGLGLGIVGPTLIAHGTEEQKQRYIRSILTAENIWCQLYSEPELRLRPGQPRNAAPSFDGDEFVVNGQKIWTSGAHIADWGMLLARTDRDVPKHQGISCFILDMHAAGRRGAAAQADHRQLGVLPRSSSPTCACRPRT